MNRVRLTFKSKSVETEYQRVNLPFVHQQFYDYFRIQMVFLLIMSIISTIKENFSVRRVSSLVGFFFLMVFFLLVKRFLNKNIFRFIIVFICSGLGFMFIELIHMELNGDGVEKSTCFLFLVFQFYLDLIVLTRIGWIFSSMVYFLNLFYFWERFTLFDSKYKEEAVVGTVLILVNFAIIGYRHEKISREYFKDLHDSNEGLRKFKELMQGVLPSSIIIVNFEDNKVEFMNKHAEKLIRKKIRGENYHQLENRPFLSQEKESSKMISLQYLEEILNTFSIMDPSGFAEIKDEKPYLFDLVKKFESNKGSMAELIDSAYDFLTLHITDKPDSMQISLVDSQMKFIKHHCYEVKVCNIKWEHKTCILLVFNDQSKAKRLIELVNLDRYKNEMLATVSHDLRTPLNGVLGMMWSVLPFLREKEAKKNLLIGIRSANLLNYLINDILDFSQITYKRLRLNFESVKLVELAKEIMSLIKFQAKKKFITLQKVFKIQDTETIYSDPTRIKQILLNLLGNAIKFTDREGIITLKIEKMTCEKIRLTVIDNGIGIKSEDLDKLFVLFGKLKQTNREINKTGIGFGLTISQNLAKMLNSGSDGGIKVQSHFGKGSEFSFILDKYQIISEGEEDLVETKGNESISMNIQKYNSLGSIEKGSFNLIPNQIRILIVDDDPVNVMILEQYLKFFKLDYLSAMNGLEAVNIIEKKVIENKQDISAILMDCNMPIMDGFKASEIINDLIKKNRAKEIPIIAITANVTNADMELCFKSGMKKFLTKPLRRSELAIELQNVLHIKLIVE